MGSILSMQYWADNCKNMQIQRAKYQPKPAKTLQTKIGHLYSIPNKSIIFTAVSLSLQNIFFLADILLNWFVNDPSRKLQLSEFVPF